MVYSVRVQGLECYDPFWINHKANKNNDIK